MSLAMTKELVAMLGTNVVESEANSPEVAMDTIKLGKVELIVYPHSSGPYSVEKWEEGKLVRKLSVILEKDEDYMACMTSRQFVEQQLKLKVA